MSGHSKWNNIKRKKGAADAQKGALFTKIGREIQMAVKSGGPDPEANSKLKDVIAKAKNSNMPNDTIKRSIQKAAGLNDSDNFEEIIYEGYGPSGVAVMVRCLSDNRNRSAADVRHIYNKYGGNMGTTGCVSFMFQTKGQIIISRELYPDEEKLMLDALEAGASDIETEEEVYIILTDADQYYQVKDALEALNYQFVDSVLAPLPDNTVNISDEETLQALEKMIEALENHDDVNEVYHNWEN